MNEPLLHSTDRWNRDHAGSAAMVVAYRNLATNSDNPGFVVMKRELETDIRVRWGEASRSDMLSDPVLAAYERYDRRFGQSYHVAMQIRSIAQKGKEIPARNAIVEVMFMTEVACGVLAAAQDLDAITFPIEVDGTDGGEEYTRYDGAVETCKPGDQLMRDASGQILTSIAQGPTNTGLVTDVTTAAAFCFYYVPGVPNEIRVAASEYLDRAVNAACPDAQMIDSTVVVAKG